MAAQYVQKCLDTGQCFLSPLGHPAPSLADKLRQIGELEALERERCRAGLLLHDARPCNALRRWPQADRDVASLRSAGILQYQPALGAAHVVPQDHIAGPFAGQLGTVGNAQRGTLRLEGGTRAR